MTTQQQANPEQQVLEVIECLIDEQLADGEPAVPAERHCRCGQLWHGLPVGSCPGTPAVGESVHRLKWVRGLGGHGMRVRAELPRLTPKRLAALEHFREDWMAAERSGAPSERGVAEAGVRTAYQSLGLPAPERYLWFDSPLAAVMAAGIVAGDLYVNEIHSAHGDPVDPRRITATLRAAGVCLGRDRYSPQGKAGRVTKDLVVNARRVNPFNFKPWEKHLTGFSAVEWHQTHTHIERHLAALAVRNLLWNNGGGLWAFDAMCDQPIDQQIIYLAALAALGIEPYDAAGLIQVGRQVSWWCGFEDVAILAERPPTVQEIDGVRTAVYRDGFTASTHPKLGYPRFPSKQYREPISWRPAQGLKSLTAERCTALTEFIEGWRTDTMSTRPVDRAAAEAGMCQMYQAEGLEPPKTVLWFDSPLAGALAQSLMWMHGHTVHTSWTNSWMASDQAIRERCYKHFLTQIESWLGSSRHERWAWEAQFNMNEAVAYVLRGNIHRDRWHSVAETSPEIWRTATARVHAHLGYVGPDIPASTALHTASWSYGSQSAPSLTNYMWDGWRGFSDSAESSLWLAALLSSLDVPVPAMQGRIQVVRNTGWWWPMNDIVIATERPEQIRTDPQGRPHNPDGPAIIYRDGFSVYCWHGDAVPADLIETSWDLSRILKEWGAAQWCGAEKLGWDTVLSDLGEQPVASAPDPQHPGQTLHLFDIPSKLLSATGRWRIVVSTRGFDLPDGQRRHWLKVSPTHIDPIAASAEARSVTVRSAAPKVHTVCQGTQ
ncbi:MULTISPECIES: DUF6745 domain-containing protein [unclassified Mycolicibacterium]|uniref:DUF6745 domain-containing protein n=1 Tax=Mycolicibacterium sp. CBMA 213 TaxID=1968788 RepID=A0A343VRI1_9MYCO|nr:MULTISPECIES: hypothetical protein [unclassified Mycolicibacterium]AVN58505.1 hypothetical protein B5P44_p00210 [Mycolicibacterium sp. CBMA 213]MUL61151.1 hypothetical protein [Mycolicibacterium sp. CBMA 335]